MRLDCTFQKIFLLNLRRRPDRLEAAQAELSRVGVYAEVVHSIDAKEEPDTLPGLYNSPGSSALARTVLNLIERASAERIASFLLLEDDVVFHADFQAKLEALTLPADWEAFYLGCQHVEPPESVAPGIVRVMKGYDTHALGLSAQMYPAVVDVLNRKYHFGACESDVRISFLQPFRRMYAALPNLTWQRVATSDIRQRTYSNYDARGNQRWNRHNVKGFSENE